MELGWLYDSYEHLLLLSKDSLSVVIMATKLMP